MDDQKLPLLEDDNSYDEEPSTRVERRILFCAVNKASKYVFNWFLKEIWLKKDTVIIVYCPKLPKKVNKEELLALESSEPVTQKLIQKMYKTAMYYEDLCTEKKVNFKFKILISHDVGKALCQIYKSEHAERVVMPMRKYIWNSSDRKLRDYVFGQLGLHPSSRIF